MNIPIWIIFEVVCFLASLTLFFQKSLSIYLKCFPFFLLLTIIVEIIGIVMFRQGKSNILLYNLFAVLTIDFYLFIIRSLIRSLVFRRVIFVTLIIYPILSVVNIAFFQIGAFHSITYSLGCLFIVAACIMYFFELFQLKYAINLLKEPAFWICSALLFFFTCTLPFFGMTNFLFRVSPVIIQNLGAIMNIINFLLYSLFTIAFLCRLKLKK